MAAVPIRAHLALLAALTLSISMPAHASEDDIVIDGDESPAAWFVELSAPSTSDGNTAAAVATSHNAFKNAAQAKGVSYQERFAFGDLWNGFAVTASGADIAALRALPDVKNIWPVVTMSLPAADAAGGEAMELAFATRMTGADYVQETLGITGKNVKVGVMDTGIDYRHPDLGGCFGPSCRVITGWDFVGDSYNADPTSSTYQPVPHPDPDPRDCNGHGTHVAGIAGASGAVKGVAPGVRFGAYRVFGCDGATSSDVMLAAMERALADHMDVLNMSIGAGFQWPQYPTAVGADRLVEKHGMVVVASAGNNGPMGTFSVGAPGVGEKVISVASFDNTHLTLPFFAAGSDERPFGYSQATAAPAAPTTGTAPLARTGTATSMSDACMALAPGSLAGKVALIRRGTCGFNAKAINAQNAGALAVLIYNNVLGLSNITVAGPPNVTIPVVSLGKADGELLDSRLAAGPVSLTWTSQTQVFASESSGLASSFTSFGSAPDLSLKPDIGAPGGFIRSTYPLEKGGYAVVSGTSMASPHVAGAVALLIESRSKNLRELGPERVRAILQNSAEPHLFWQNTTQGVENVHRQGAGMLDIRAAIEASADVTPGKLSLGESQAGPQTRTLTLRSLQGTGKSVTYTFSHLPALATGPNNFSVMPTTVTSSATVAFSKTAVTLKNNASDTVDVTITAPAMPVRGQYGGYLVISGSDGSTYRVPYAGFIGDYQSIVVLNGTTRVCRLNAMGQLVLVPFTGGTFTYANNMQIPIFCVHFDHQSRSVVFNVKDVATDTTFAAPAFSFDYFGRNTGATTVFTFSWDGGVGLGEDRAILPNGTYQISVQVLKALGDPANPAHTETLVLGSLTIARP